MSHEQETSIEGIAIIGMSGRLPGAPNLERFWSNLIEGIDSISPITDEELRDSGIKEEVINNPAYIKFKGILGNADEFDASFFGYSPRVAELMDPQHRIFLECAWEAMENSGCNPDSYEGRIGVYAGESMNTYWVHNLIRHVDLIASAESLQAAIGNDKDSLTTEVSYKLNLTGPAVTIQSSSSTSLVAVHMAVQSLLNYECDIALSGGVSVHFPEKAGYLYHEGGTTSPDGKCRPFDAEAKGFVSGHGAGVVVLKRLQDALDDKDTIYAVIKGSAINNDGSNKVSYMAPSVQGQAEVIAMALADASVHPETIRYIEAHGTATNIGDPIEIAALTQAYRTKTDKTQYCAIGSVKSNIGHLDTAAGVIGLIKAALVLKHKIIPPTIHFENPNPRIDFQNTPFFVNSELTSWEAADGFPRRAGVSSFGMGGTNAHMILEEFPSLAAKSEQTEPDPFPEIMTLSAKTPSSLRMKAKQLADDLEAKCDLSWRDAAYTLNTGRRLMSYRYAQAIMNREQWIASLRDFSHANTEISYTDKGLQAVFLFTGQGSQYVNMAKDLYKHEPVFKRYMDRSAELLIPLLGLDIREILYPAQDEEEAAGRLRQTELAQPILFVIEYATAQMWIHRGIRPQAMAGHSIGEYAAAVLAGVFKLEDALKLVVERGRLMQLLPKGSMLSVHLSEVQIQALLNEHIALAAVNSSQSCVLSGDSEAIHSLRERLDSEGVTCMLLQTSHAFHSHMMDPVLKPMADTLGTIRLNRPAIPIVSSMTGEWLTDDQAQSIQYWTEHLRNPVQFDKAASVLLEEPESVLIEVGPGHTLCTLINNHLNKKKGHTAIASIRHPKVTTKDDVFFANALAKAWEAGLALDWKAHYGEHSYKKVPLPAYPFERKRYWLTPIPDAPGTTVDRGEERQDIDDWFYSQIWKQTPILRSNAGRKNAVEVFMVLCDQRAGQDFIDLIEQNGNTAIVVSPGDSFYQLSDRWFSIQPDEAADYVQLFNKLRQMSIYPTQIIHAWSAFGRGTDWGDLEDGRRRYEQAQIMGSYSVIHLVQAIQQTGAERPIQLMTVTSDAVSVLGNERLVPEQAPVVGLVRSISQEFANLSCKHVDISANMLGSRHSRANLVQSLFTESLRTGDRLTAYRSGRRWIAELEAVRIKEDFMSATISRSGDKGCIVILGGLGEIGYSLAESLVQCGNHPIVLVGRTELPTQAELGVGNASSEILRKVELLRNLVEQSNAQVTYVSVDVADEKRMTQMIDDAIAAYGSIHGIIHSVGEINQDLLLPLNEINRGNRAVHLPAKVDSLYVLKKIAEQVQPDFCVLTSSLASLLGGIGYGTYSTANQFMDLFAYQQNQAQKHTHWISINWDAWSRAEWLASDGLGSSLIMQKAILPSEGKEAFRRILHAVIDSQVFVSTHSLNRRLNQQQATFAQEETQSPGQAAPSIAHARPHLQTEYEAPKNDIEQELCGIWGDILQLHPIGVNDNFFELGGNSLIGIRLISQINEQFGSSVSPVSIYAGPTVRSLAEVLSEEGNRSLADEGISRGAKRRQKALQRNH
ncbi:type I polyketide synthase [Paenibacillus sp. GbtcB18]|uniref:type I polyketide synthase n=1 Tax=Paenibacillus sp. GbtcB18 TaxID=2824763 RepID=UPI001C301FDD|nr:type I polyketide synthase [Paenibacillus sp. GbtcB18]